MCSFQGCVALVQELNEKRITLMEGSALSERDLQRARAESANAVFLLANRFSSDYKQEDLLVQFQASRLVTLHLRETFCHADGEGFIKSQADCAWVLPGSVCLKA